MELRTQDHSRSVYSLDPKDAEFAPKEVQRWLRLRCLGKATKADTHALRREGHVSLAIVTTSAHKTRLVVDYSAANESLEPTTFRIDQLEDLTSVPKPNNSLFKADIIDALLSPETPPVRPTEAGVQGPGCSITPYPGSFNLDLIKNEIRYCRARRSTVAPRLSTCTPRVRATRAFTCTLVSRADEARAHTGTTCTVSLDG